MRKQEEIEENFDYGSLHTFRRGITYEHLRKLSLCRLGEEGSGGTLCDIVLAQLSLSGQMGGNTHFERRIS